MNKNNYKKLKNSVDFSFYSKSLFNKFFRRSNIAEEPIILKFHPFLPFPTSSATLPQKINNFWKNFKVNNINIERY